MAGDIKQRQEILASLPEGSVLCEPKDRSDKPEILAPADHWKVLLSRLYPSKIETLLSHLSTSEIKLLGRKETPLGPQIVYYRFTNAHDPALKDPLQRSAEPLLPLIDLSQDPVLQREMRKAMDDLERIGHITFLPATEGSRLDLAIGYATRWGSGQKDSLVAGHASYPDKNGVSHLSLIANKSDFAAHVRHELGHSLGLNHPRNYPTQPYATRCDVGPKLDLLNQTIMSYHKTINFYGPDDVKAIQSLYGPTQHEKPYQVPVVPQKISIADATHAAAAGLVRAQIHYQKELPTTLTLNGVQRTFPAQNDTMAIVDSSEADEDVTLVDPPSRIRYIHRGGKDTLRVKGESSLIGIANEVAHTAQVRIEANAGSLILMGANHAEAETGQLTVQLVNAARAAINIHKTSKQKIASGMTGHYADGVAYELESGGAITTIVVPEQTTLRLEDAQGMLVPLPTYIESSARRSLP